MNSEYYNYVTYGRSYRFGTVIAIGSGCKFRRVGIGSRLYARYGLYRGMYPTLGSVRREGVLSDNTTCTLSGSVGLGNSDNKLFKALTGGVVSSNNIMFNTTFSRGLGLEAMNIDDRRRLSPLCGSGCLLYSAGSGFGRVGGLLRGGGAILCYSSPYRVTTLGQFLRGSCRGLMAISFIYRNIKDRSLFGESYR